jgi:hypothetical protein
LSHEANVLARRKGRRGARAWYVNGGDFGYAIEVEANEDGAMHDVR